VAVMEEEDVGEGEKYAVSASTAFSEVSRLQETTSFVIPRARRSIRAVVGGVSRMGEIGVDGLRRVMG